MAQVTRQTPKKAILMTCHYQLACLDPSVGTNVYMLNGRVVSLVSLQMAWRVIFRLSKIASEDCFSGHHRQVYIFREGSCRSCGKLLTG